ncbi:hypothetical protein M0811_00454 [Anaeramoeba ignava]|uniref:C3H1-type domain-containing protein n=1 Tax=Anaeramoeba ignava TaxID=1746090 RepID=A0A9Q0LRD7_ANAIG|nr:hypothetical protein M0811_00454 [Anaeramoeba ignava]
MEIKRNLICKHLIKKKWCHKEKHIKKRDNNLHPPNKILCLKILKFGACDDPNCPYQHVNPNNKFYETLIEKADHKRKYRDLETKRNSFFLCDLNMKDTVCSEYAQTRKCSDPNCPFQHHTKLDFIRKDPVRTYQENVQILRDLFNPFNFLNRQKLISDPFKKQNLNHQICPKLNNKKENPLGCTDVNCKYAHPNPELIQLDEPIKSNFLESMKREFCTNFHHKGKCKVIDCKFQHINIKGINSEKEEEQEERGKVHKLAARDSSIRIIPEICPTFIKQLKNKEKLECNDENCKYAHPNPKMIQSNPNIDESFLKSMKRNFCSYYCEFGNCKINKCKFQHIKLNEKEKKLYQDKYIEKGKQKHDQSNYHQRKYNKSNDYQRNYHQSNYHQSNYHQRNNYQRNNYQRNERKSNIPEPPSREIKIIHQICPKLLNKKENPLGCTDENCQYSHPNPKIDSIKSKC